MTLFLSKVKSVPKAKMGGLILVGLIAIATYLIVDPFKVTNPADPRFNPDKFRFSDYGDIRNLIPVYRDLFPIGTPKNFVDRVLVDSAGAECMQDKTFSQIWTCSYPKSYGYPRPTFVLIFDSNSKLLNIYPLGAALYPESMTIENIRNNRK